MDGSPESAPLDGGEASNSAGNTGDDAPDPKPSDPDANDGDAGAEGVTQINSEEAGPYVVGTRRIEVTVPGGRVLPVQLWYPAVESARGEALAGHPVEDFEPAGARHDTLKALIAQAPDGCTNKTMHAAASPAALGTESKFPAIVFSHCNNCTRFSSFSSSEHLASWGFIVAAPDHEGGTLYDAQADSSQGVTPAFLEVRAADMSGVIDALLDASSQALPSDLRGRIDPDRLGVFGHSFGSITTGFVLQNDTRVRAGVMIAAAPETTELGKVSIAKITQPSLFLLAREDNSIGELGNISLRDNYANYPTEAWLVEVNDAGHWSFSDLCGLTDAFKAGCGMGTRQTSAAAAFNYVNNDTARGIAAAYTLAYFGRELMNDEIAAEYLKVARPAKYVYLKHHK